jgi:prepilin-type N-terminal cleavage/methylation domain-containing protein
LVYKLSRTQNSHSLNEREHSTFLHNHRAHKRGFTLTEIAIVLGIMGTILGAIWVAAAKVGDNNKAKKVAEQVLTIASTYKQLLQKGQTGVDPACWLDITNHGVNNGAFPNDMLVNNLPVTPWGGQVVVYDCPHNSYKGVIIAYYGLSQRACSLVANAIIDPLQQEWLDIGNGGAAVVTVSPSPPSPMGKAAVPSVLTLVTSGCVSPTSTNFVRVMFPVF